MLTVPLKIRRRPEPGGSQIGSRDIGGRDMQPLGKEILAPREKVELSTRCKVKKPKCRGIRLEFKPVS